MTYCEKCMEGAPYPFCCGWECGEHTFCVNCNYKNKFEKEKCIVKSEVEDGQ